jgi:hypothetical protein
VRRLELTLVHPADSELAFTDNIVVSGKHAWALGGWYHPQITCLHSSDGGRSFSRWEPPNNTGVLDGHAEGDTLWVVGNGMIASTPIGDEPEWTVDERDDGITLFAMVADPRGHLWAMGERGTLLRSTKKRDKWRKVPNHGTTTVLHVLAERDLTWMIDNQGMVQKSPAAKLKFEIVPIPAMRKGRPLCAITRTPRGTLLVVGDLGMILRSTDNGETWKKIPIDSGAHMEDILVTRYGIVVVGDHGSILVSHDDGLSFQGFESILEHHVWAVVECDGDFLIGGDAGRVWRLERTQLSLMMRDAFEKKDPELAALAGSVHEGVEGAELVYEDALREREMW